MVVPLNTLTEQVFELFILKNYYFQLLFICKNDSRISSARKTMYKNKQNQALFQFNGGSLEITLTVPLKYLNQNLKSYLFSK